MEGSESARMEKGNQSNFTKISLNNIVNASESEFIHTKMNNS